MQRLSGKTVLPPLSDYNEAPRWDQRRPITKPGLLSQWQEAAVHPQFQWRPPPEPEFLPLPTSNEEPLSQVPVEVE